MEDQIMPTIRVDEDVYVWLQQRAKPFVDTPNSVLRRELKIESQGGTSRPADRTTGELMPLLTAGELRVGEELVWKRRHVGYRASVTVDGWLELEDGQTFAAPSGAARALSGYEVNGWRAWRRVSDGVSLSSLRDRL
jgi:hypothetical protein